MTGAKVSIKVEYNGGKNTKFNWEYSSPSQEQTVEGESSNTNENISIPNTINSHDVLPILLSNESQSSITSILEETFNSFAAKLTEQMERTVTKCVNDNVRKKLKNYYFSLLAKLYFCV